MSETTLLSGGPRKQDLYQVTADQQTIVGNGTTENPLRAVGGSGGDIQVFEYQVTGLEPDPSQITIPLPIPIPGAAYGVEPTCQGCQLIVGFDVPGATRTDVDFLLVATADMSPGDVVLIKVSRLNPP